MAGTLQITDGTTTINLLNTSAGLYIEDGGWKPAVAKEDENGDYEDMIEVITCTWTQTNDDDRAETLKSIKRLDRKAREHWRKRLVNGWVWLVASTHSETDTRYAIIKSIDIKELDPRHWAANGPVKVTLIIKHILWWGIAPNGTPTTVVNGQTVSNKAVGATVNYVEISAANVRGDAPALTVISYEPSTSYVLSPMFVSIKRGSSANLNNFITYLTINADLQSGSGLSIQTDSSLPGGQYGRWSGTTDTFTANFQLPNDAEYFSGHYHLYALCRASVENAVTVSYYATYGVTVPTPTKPKAKVFYPGAALVNISWCPVYLGTLSILGNKLPVGVDSPTIYRVGIKCDKSASANFDIAGLMLMPLNDGIFAAGREYGGSNGNINVIDGRAQQCYATDSANEIVYENLEHHGQFLTLEPGQNQRLYFFQKIAVGSLSPLPATVSDWQPSRQFIVDVKLIERYTSLRGND